MTQNSSSKKINKGLYKQVFAYVKPYKKQFYGSVFLAILIAVFSPVRPYLINVTVNSVIANKHSLSPFLQHILFINNQSSLSSFIIAITIFQIIFLIVETLVRFGFSFITSWLGQYVVNDIRNKVFGKVLNYNLNQFDTTPIGTLTTRTINDMESINDIFSDGLIPIIADLLTIVFTVVSMLLLSWKLTLISLIPFPFLLVATYYFKESVNKSFTNVRNAVAALNAFVQEHLTGMMVVKSFAVEDKEMKKFKAINQQHKQANIKAIFAYSVFFPVVELVLAISLGLLVWYVAKQQLNAGLLVAFILYINQIFRPLRIIADKFNVIQMGMIAAERVFKVLNNNDVLVNKKDAIKPIQKLQGNIEFKNVSFGYDDKKNVLNNISFSLKPAQTVALVGQTGSGKTTITQLLNRLYQHQQGNILIDGIDIEDYDIDYLRSNMGIVLQDVFLFSGSIFDNITLRNKNITMQQVVEATKLLGIHEHILKLPNGYHFNVMERGNTLSLGQRQLISFIRAVLFNPSILIMDEATSSIDSESEILVQQATEKLIQNRTSIIIAHRLSTIIKADIIIVLHEGKIVEMGNHNNLLQQNGYYAGLYKMQFEEEVDKAFLV